MNFEKGQNIKLYFNDNGTMIAKVLTSIINTGQMLWIESDRGVTMAINPYSSNLDSISIIDKDCKQ